METDQKKVNNAYLAGLIDGEGWITATRKPGRSDWGMTIGITNTNKELLAWV